MPSAPTPSTGPGPILKIALYLLAVLLLGALLAPLLYSGGKWLAGLIVSFQQTNTPVLGWIGNKLTVHEFDSYYNRAFLLSALGLLWPFLKWMGLQRQSLGLRKNPLKLADLLTGIVLSGGLLALMGLALMQAGAFTAKPAPDWSALLGEATLAAFGAALLEEWIFRGIFLGVALRAARPRLAILSVSAFFSILHLIQATDLNISERTARQELSTLRKTNWPLLATNHASDPAKNDWITNPSLIQFAPSKINPTSGLAMTAEIFQRNARPALFFSEFLTLFAIGLILAVARLRTASLALPIGLHAGWIFINTLYMGSTLTTRELRRGAFNLGGSQEGIPLIGQQLKIGLIPLGVLLLTALAVFGWLRLRRKKLPADPAASPADSIKPVQ
jgi:membrane protease YdiL (CAAX protease family)